VLVDAFEINGTITRPIGFNIEDEMVLSINPPAEVLRTEANIIFS
jgi:hypothetical protein